MSWNTVMIFSRIGLVCAEWETDMGWYFFWVALSHHFSAEGKGWEWNIYILYSVYFCTGKLFSRIIFFFNALCGKGNAKSYLALCSMSFWNEKEWLIFKVLPAVFLRGIALCHYFLEFWVAIPNASLSNLRWKGARVTLIMLSAPVC